MGKKLLALIYDFNNNANMVNVEHGYLDVFPILFKPLLQLETTMKFGLLVIWIMWLKVYPHLVPPLLHRCLSTFSTCFDGLVKLKCLI